MTQCQCSEFRSPIKKLPQRDILNFVTSFPIIYSPSRSEIEQNILRKWVKRKIQNCPTETQEDKVRDQHDRGKRRKRL